MSKATKSASGPPKEFPGQHPEEKVVLVFRQHPVVMRHPLIYGMLAMLLAIIPLLFWPLSSLATKIALYTPLLVIAYWFYHWVSWHYSVYIVTDQRLIDITQKGFFNRKVNEVSFDKIQSINYHIKGLQAALLKYGDISIQTYANEWVLNTIHYPEEVHSQLIMVAHGITSTPPQK